MLHRYLTVWERKFHVIFMKALQAIKSLFGVSNFLTTPLSQALHVFRRASKPHPNPPKYF